MNKNKCERARENQFIREKFDFELVTDCHM